MKQRGIFLFLLLAVFVFCGTVVGVELYQRGKLLASTQSDLMKTRPSESPLRAFIECRRELACRQTYDETLDTGNPFPYRLLMLAIFSGGFALMLTFRKTKVLLHDGMLATLKDFRRLRMRDWLENKRCHIAIALGRHVRVPDAGEKRKNILRGESNEGIDSRMLVIPKGYGKRNELPNGAVFGTSRSGKTMHLTSQAVRWMGSFIALDVKGEIFARTSGLTSRRGRVFVLSPEGKGNQFSPFPYFFKSAAGVKTAASILSGVQREQGNGKHFVEKASQGIEAALLASRALEVPPLDFIYETMLEGGMGSFISRIRAVDDPDVQFALNAFLDPHGGADFDLARALEDGQLTSSWGTMSRALSPFLTKNVRWLMRRNDFHAHLLMTERAYIYLQFPETSLRATSRVYDLLVNAIAKELFDYVADELKLKAPKVPVMIFLDELAVAPISDLEDLYATAAGRYVTPILYCQSPFQLEQIYGHNASKGMAENFGFTLFYKCENIDTAKQISEMAGKVSRKQIRRSRPWKILPSVADQTISEGEQSREVISPEEVLLIGGEDREVILAAVSGKPLVVLRRIDPRVDKALGHLMSRYEPLSIPAAEHLEYRPMLMPFHRKKKQSTRDAECQTTSRSRNRLDPEENKTAVPPREGLNVVKDLSTWHDLNTPQPPSPNAQSTKGSATSPPKPDTTKHSHRGSSLLRGGAHLKGESPMQKRKEELR